MRLEFTFSKQVSHVSFEHIHKKFYESFKTKNPNIDVLWNDSGLIIHKSYGGPWGPTNLSIRNTENGKYIVVSYWDYCFELFNREWDEWGNLDKLVAVFSSAGLHHLKENFNTRYDKAIIEPFSYACYNYDHENLIQNLKPFNLKNDNELLIRGSVYGFREKIRSVKPSMITTERLEYDDYWQEFNNSKIGLSLNGAGIVCYRDMEILSAGSVLFRPYHKNLLFHNPLIPDVHYVSFEEVDDPVKQVKIIEDKFNEIRYNYEYLENIAKNGHEWYLNNGTVNKNVEILHKLTNLYLKQLE